jgi:hypothetical protein
VPRLVLKFYDFETRLSSIITISVSLKETRLGNNLGKKKLGKANALISIVFFFYDVMSHRVSSNSVSHIVCIGQGTINI